MWEITVESKTRVIECGRAVLYETKYRGLQEENGKIRLLSYFGKRMPLAEAQLRLAGENLAQLLNRVLGTR